MIYDIPAASEELSQGDIIDGCPILFWEYPAAGAAPESGSSSVRVAILTQACDLAQAKATRLGRRGPQGPTSRRAGRPAIQDDPRSNPHAQGLWLVFSPGRDQRG